MTDTTGRLPCRRPVANNADTAGLLERWKDRDRNNRTTAALQLVSPRGSGSFWQLTLAGRVRHVAVSVVVSEYPAGGTLVAPGWVKGPTYRVELARAGEPRPGLVAVIRGGVEAWDGLDTARIPGPIPPDPPRNPADGDAASATGSCPCRG